MSRKSIEKQRREMRRLVSETQKAVQQKIDQSVGETNSGIKDWQAVASDVERYLREADKRQKSASVPGCFTRFYRLFRTGHSKGHSAKERPLLSQKSMRLS
jgi:hypothetical protein